MKSFFDVLYLDDKNQLLLRDKDQLIVMLEKKSEQSN